MNPAATSAQPEIDMVLELLAYGGVLYVDAREVPVMVTVRTEDRGPRNFAGGSVSQALAQACRSLKSKPAAEAE